MSVLSGSIGGHVGLVLLSLEQIRMVPTLSIKMLIDFLGIYFPRQNGRTTAAQKSMTKKLVDRELS